MIRTVRNVLLFTLVVAVAVPLAAAPKQKKGKKGGKRGSHLEAAVLKRFEKAELTDEQVAKIKELAAEYQPKVAAAQEKLNLTPEQKKARAAAMKKAKAEGKKGKELRAAVDAALNLSTEQKEAQQAAQKEMRQLQAEFNKAAYGVLTAEQQAKVPGPKKGKGGKKAGKAGGKKGKKKKANT